MHILRHVSILAALTLAACGGSETSGCAGDGVTVSNAWLRAADEGRTMSAAYAQLCNGSDTSDRLIAARFEGAAATEIHITTTTEDGVSSMAPMEQGLLLAPQGTAELAPGGAHIMLMGLTGPIAAGDEVAITLQFENADPVTVMFEAMAPSDAAAHDHH